MAKMTREQFISKYGLGPGGTFLADDRGGNAASEVAGQSVADYYDSYLADGVAPRMQAVGGDGSTAEVPWNWGGGETRDGFNQPVELDAWSNVDPHPESNNQDGWNDAWTSFGRPIAKAVAMYYGVGALNGMAGAGATGATATPVTGSGGAMGTTLPSTGAVGGTTGNLGFSGSMAMPELGASMPAGVTSFSSAIPAAAPAAGSWMPTMAQGLGGATAAGTGLQIGAGTAAEGAATMGSASPEWLSTLKDYGSTASSFLKDNPLLTQLGGAALGAMASGDQTQSSSNSRDPWAPAQPYLLDNLKTNANAQEHYRANPFSDLQKQQYQGLFNNLANNNANMPGLLANASNFGQSKRGQMPAMTGLLSGTQAPAIDWAAYQNIGRR